MNSAPPTMPASTAAMPPDLIRRMDVLADEICRRERAGTFTEDDWKDAREGFQAVTDLIICRDGHVIRIEPTGNLTAIPAVTPATEITHEWCGTKGWAGR
jgi:hypothetical protein